MECVTPPALTDEQILIFLDVPGDNEDDARSEMAAIADHLAHCPSCAERAVELSQTEQALTAALYRIDCPPPQTLGEFQLGLLSGAAQMAIADHLEICTRCRQEVAQLSDFMAMDAFLLPQEQSADVSSSQPDRKLGSVRTLIATLIDRIDDAFAPLSPALAGLRGQEADQQVFQIDDIQIILDVQPATAPSDQYAIYGLILGLDPEPGAQVAVWREAAYMESADVDDLGNFVIPALRRGAYELILNSGNTEIHMPGIAIG